MPLARIPGQLWCSQAHWACHAEAAADLAAQSGMTVKAGVTRLTTYLVVGDQDLTVLGGHSRSSKHRKAEEMQAAGHSDPDHRRDHVQGNGGGMM